MRNMIDFLIFSGQFNGHSSNSCSPSLCPSVGPICDIYWPLCRVPQLVIQKNDFQTKLQSYCWFVILLYICSRPLSGKNVMRDLRNTFLFTTDALQVERDWRTDLYWSLSRSLRLSTSSSTRTSSTRPGSPSASRGGSRSTSGPWSSYREHSETTSREN